MENFTPHLSIYLSSKFNFYLSLQVYDTSHQYSDDNICKDKWIVDGPFTININYSDIRNIREVTEDDLHDHCCWNSYFKTKTCILEYFDENERKYKTEFLACSLKEAEKLYKIVQKKWNESRNKYQNLVNKINKEFEQEISEIEHNI